MSDVHTKEIRSYNMSCIKSKNTVPEITIRRYLFSRGLRYKVNVSSLPGKPDIVFTKLQIAIFINGCFWHSHGGCARAKIPKTRTEWWTEKIEKNKNRDKKNIEKLVLKGWQVIVIWECEITGDSKNYTLIRLFDMLTHLRKKGKRGHDFHNY